MIHFSNGCECFIEGTGHCRPSHNYGEDRYCSCLQEHAHYAPQQLHPAGMDHQACGHTQASSHPGIFTSSMDLDWGIRWKTLVLKGVRRRNLWPTCPCLPVTLVILTVIKKSSRQSTWVRCRHAMDSLLSRVLRVSAMGGGGEGIHLTLSQRRSMPPETQQQGMWQ